MSQTPSISADHDQGKARSSSGAPQAVPAGGGVLPSVAMHDTTDAAEPSPDEKTVKKIKDPPEGHSGQVAPMELPKWRFWAILASLMISVFLFALDQLIVATAIPKITEEFNSLTQLSWLASGFFLTLLSFNLLYSQWMNIFPSKHVMMFAIFIFEIGSLICGVAPNMDVLIFGRAFAGLGAAGIFSGAMIIIAELTPLHSRAQYFALFGVCFAIASVIGPLVGGAFADHVSWRWCFYINLPFGGIAMASIAFFQPARPPMGRAESYKGYSKTTFLQFAKATFLQFAKCDWVGMLLSMAWAICFILATQWGGVTKKWGDGSVIATLVLSGILPIVFCVYEWAMKDHAFFRIRLLKRRNIAGGSIVTFFVFGIMMVLIYYLSLNFQAVHNTSATGAGVRLLPLILVQVFTLILSSRIIPRIGRFKPAIVIGPMFLAIASGLFYSITPSTPIANLYGYQVILGIGTGSCIQNVMIAVQYELKREPWLISLGTGLAVFTGFAGRIVALSAAGSIFENMIQRHLKSSVTGITTEIIDAVVNDASAVWSTVPDDMRDSVIEAYTKALTDVYILALPMSICALGGALLIRNDKMTSKEDEEKKMAEAKENAKAEEGDVERSLSGRQTLSSTTDVEETGQTEKGLEKSQEHI